MQSLVRDLAQEERESAQLWLQLLNAAIRLRTLYLALMPSSNSFLEIPFRVLE
jgi:hypothetical protein